MTHPLRASRAPSRGQCQRPGEADSAAFTWFGLLHAASVVSTTMEN